MSQNPNTRETDEARGLRTMARDTDQAAITAIEARFGDQIPPERLKAMRELDTSFESPAEFRRRLEAAVGGKAPENVAGWSIRTAGEAHVRMGDPAHLPEAVIHERLHQAAHPEADKILGRDLDEGLTTVFSGEVLSAGGKPELVGYPEKRRAAEEALEQNGREPLEDAYFAGDTARLERRLAELSKRQNPEI